jgi:hypothetical protein
MPHLSPPALPWQVRLLPCRHYFHAPCIDKWFCARAYQQRSCPLCKADPLANATLPTMADASAAAEPDAEEGTQLADLRQLADTRAGLNTTPV